MQLIIIFLHAHDMSPVLGRNIFRIALFSKHPQSVFFPQSERASGFMYFFPNSLLEIIMPTDTSRRPYEWQSVLHGHMSSVRQSNGTIQGCPCLLRCLVLYLSQDPLMARNWCLFRIFFMTLSGSKMEERNHNKIYRYLRNLAQQREEANVPPVDRMRDTATV
jgi:hypothetical protein